MLTLAQFDLPVLVTALLIGIAAGRWMFRRPGQAAADPDDKDKSPT